MSTIGNESPVEATRPSDVSIGRKLFDVRTVVSLAIGLVILLFGLSRLQVNLQETLRVMGTANWRLLIAALVVYYATFPIRALRWRGMLQNAGCRSDEIPGVPRLAEIIYLSWFANSVVPAKLGDVYRAYLLRQQSKVPFSKAGGTIVAERLIDLAVLLVLLGASGLLSFRGVLPGTVLTVLEIGSALVVLAGLAFLGMRQLDPIVRRLVPARLQGIYGHFLEGVLGSFGGYHWLIGLTALSWLAESGRLLLVTQSVGLVLSPNVAVNFLMVVFIALGSALLTAPPGTPAGLGYVEASIVYVLALLGAPQSYALSVALLDRSISFLSLIVGGLIVYVVSQRRG